MNAEAKRFTQCLVRAFYNSKYKVYLLADNCLVSNTKLLAPWYL